MVLLLDQTRYQNLQQIEIYLTLVVVILGIHLLHDLVYLQFQEQIYFQYLHKLIPLKYLLEFAH